MISRVADHCFWLGRYLERTESTARVLVVTSQLALDPELTRRAAWMPVLVVAGEGPSFLERFGEDAADDADRVQRFMTWDEDNWTCIWQSVRAARDNARSIREVVSLELWETLNELWLWLQSDAARAEFDAHRYAFYRRVRQGIAQVFGHIEATMLEDSPRDFIRLGVLLERCGQTARMLDVHHHVLHRMDGGHGDTALWLSLLRACSAFEPFMKRHRGDVGGDAVARFLVLDPAFPRSIRHCVRHARVTFERIRPPGKADLPGEATERRLRALEAWVAGLGAADVGLDAIHARLTHVVDETAAICDGLGRELLGTGPASDAGGASQ